jgi:hypothetical protein
VISEQIANIKALGMSIDAGIQYTTGSKKQIGFGMSLRNVGPKMRYYGDGLAVKAKFTGSDDEVTLQSRSQPFELPLLMNIGAHYRFDIGTQHQLFTSGAFTSNAFAKDQFCLGLEYRRRLPDQQQVSVLKCLTRRKLYLPLIIPTETPIRFKACTALEQEFAFRQYFFVFLLLYN